MGSVYLVLVAHCLILLPFPPLLLSYQIMSLLSGGGLPPAQSTPPKPVKSTKPTTTTTTVVTEEKLVRLPDEVAADQSSAPVLLAPEVELESTGVRERVSKGKGREQL
jgi:hypothetical protein